MKEINIFVKNLSMNKNIIQHFISIITFIIVLLIYFYPTVQGKVLVQEDITRSMSTSKEARDYRESTGEEALWTNSQFGGMPTFQMNTEYPSNLMRYFEKGLKLVKILPDNTGLMFMLLIGFYFLLISIGIDKKISVIGAIAFAFSTFFVISLGVGHNSKLRTIGYIAPIVAGVLLTFNGRKILGSAITAFTAALAINANHFQITYYLSLLLLVIWSVYLYKAIKEKAIKEFILSSVILLFAGILAIGPNISKLWTTYSYSGETMRGGGSELAEYKDKSNGGLNIDYALRWSYGKMESLNLLIPNFYGGASTKRLNTSSDTYKELIKNGTNKRQAKKIIERLPMYWGDQQFTSGPTYLGAVILFLFLIGTLIIRGPTKWWIIIGSMLSLMIAWGSNLIWFNQLMFDYFPMFNKFRAPSMALTILCFTAPLLAMITLNKILNKDHISTYWHKIKLSFYILGGICLFFYLFGNSIFTFESLYQNGVNDTSLKKSGFIDVILQDRANLLKDSAIRSFLLISSAFALIWLYYKQNISKNIFIVIIGLLIISDIWIIDREYLGTDDFKRKSAKEKSFIPSIADQQILNDKNLNYRVFNLSVNPFTDAITSYHHKSVGGYHGAKLIRYQDLIDKHLSKQNIQVINMLNTRYIITQDNKTGQKRIQRNPDALGNAWFINKILWANNADNEIALLGEFNAKDEVVIDNRYKKYISNIEEHESEITLINYKPNHLTYKANVDKKESFAVFSEIYYEGSGNDWQAYINGEPKDHIRVNYLLRGLKIPKGEHLIEFKFQPPSYFIGEKISFIFSIIIIILFFGALFIEYKKHRILTSNNV